MDGWRTAAWRADLAMDVSIDAAAGPDAGTLVGAPVLACAYVGVVLRVGTVTACRRAGSFLVFALRLDTDEWQRVALGFPTFSLETVGDSLGLVVTGFRRGGFAAAMSVHAESARTLCTTRYAAQMALVAHEMHAILAENTAVFPVNVWARVILFASKFHADLARRPPREVGMWLALANECENAWYTRVCGVWAALESKSKRVKA